MLLDKTAKLWDTHTGQFYKTVKGMRGRGGRSGGATPVTAALLAWDAGTRQLYSTL